MLDCGLNFLACSDNLLAEMADFEGFAAGSGRYTPEEVGSTKRFFTYRRGSATVDIRITDKDGHPGSPVV